MKKTVYIQRGLPGSGKSTRAKVTKEKFEALGFKVTIVSADHFFEKTGKYIFVPSKLDEAHKECFTAFLDAMMTDDLIIVDNTNTRLWEFENYIKVAKIASADIIIDEIKATDIGDVKFWHARCTHNVPYDKMLLMFNRWEDYENRFQISI